MAAVYLIKTNPENVVVEYHDYQDAPDSFMPSEDHVKLPSAPTLDPVGRYYQPETPEDLFSARYADGFEPDEDAG